VTSARRARPRERAGSGVRLGWRQSIERDAAPEGSVVRTGTEGAARGGIVEVPEGDEHPSNGSGLTGAPFVGHPCPCCPSSSGTQRRAGGSAHRAGGSMSTTRWPSPQTRSDLGHILPFLVVACKTFSRHSRRSAFPLFTPPGRISAHSGPHAGAFTPTAPGQVRAPARAAASPPPRCPGKGVRALHPVVNRSCRQPQGMANCLLVASCPDLRTLTGND
jgi:hypothetical protein